MCFAAVNGYSHVAKVLLEHGAAHNLATIEGQTPADLAFANGYSMVYILIFLFTGNINSSFYGSNLTHVVIFS